MSCPTLVRSMFLLWVPLIALASPERIGEPDCKSLVSHSGFAEFVLPSDGGTHKLELKVNPSVKWTVRNSGYIEWIKILEGDSGVGPGTVTVRLDPNTGKYCRVGVLTISGLTRIYGLPITILQRGTTESAGAEKRPQPSNPSVVNLTPFSSENSQAPGREYRKVPPKR